MNEQLKKILEKIAGSFQPAADAIKAWEPTPEQKELMENAMKAMLTAISALIANAFKKQIEDLSKEEE